MHVIHKRNVNYAYETGAQLIRDHGLLTTTRAGDAYVVPFPVTTVYDNPCERVLWDENRDANPFFHFFEALWILNGQCDVATLAFFNKRMADYSDDGVTFHAPYGYRLRETGINDQIKLAVGLLQQNPLNRQVMLQIWDQNKDLGASKKDIPCNDMIKLRIVDGKLDLMVFCRSNDMIWGAYGANVVQFSTLQEYIAGCVGVPVGKYYQISCDFHAYTAVFEKNAPPGYKMPFDLYSLNVATPFSMFTGLPDDGISDYRMIAFDGALDSIMRQVLRAADGQSIDYGETGIPYFDHAAFPLLLAWCAWKRNDVQRAIEYADKCHATDWAMACKRWLLRRLK